MKTSRDTALVLRILARIQTHTYSFPITGDALAAEFGVSWRKVADVIEDLRDNGHKIGSRKDPPMGYFLARHPDQLQSTLDHLESQAKKILARRNRLANWGGREPSLYEQEAI